MEIWAHRGLSRLFPENTLQSFAAACEYEITGIELDIQLTKDDKIVVIHDETVDRTTDGKGAVRKYTLEELKKLRIKSPDGYTEIPTIEEVLDLMEPYCRKYGVRINIELKNNKTDYPGMEEMIYNLIKQRHLEEYIVFSTFNYRSLARMQKIDPTLSLGFLSEKAGDCAKKARRLGIKVIHPFIGSMVRSYAGKGYTIRCYNVMRNEPFYPEQRKSVIYDFEKLKKLGITDIFTNNCDFYCSKRGEN